MAAWSLFSFYLLLSDVECFCGLPLMLLCVETCEEIVMTCQEMPLLALVMLDILCFNLPNTSKQVQSDI
jgi:hypothetical protein